MAKRKTTPTNRGVPSMVPGRRGFDAAADKVLAAMELRGWGPSDLARASGVTREVLSYWLTGARPLRSDYLLALLAALDLDILPRSLAVTRDS